MRTSLLKAVYNIAGVVLPPIAAPFFLCHSRGKRRLSERFGCWNVQSDNLLWFHGASVGEVIGLLPIIDGCRSRFPNYQILLTATSPTGLDLALGKTDFQALLPFDNAIWLKKAIKGLGIKAFIFGETEIWPTLLDILGDVPRILVNGRCSDATLRIWDKKVIKPVITECLASLDAVFAINQKYADRFSQHGAKNVSVNGNTKYDSEPSIKSKQEAAELKASFFKDDLPTLILGSLRPGEEDIWFPALKREDINVLVAPRHQEKFEYFATKLAEYKIDFARRSKNDKTKRVVLLDTMRELEKAYSFADLAFIGATLVPKLGGHNPLEAAAYGVPIVIGPYYENIDNIVAELNSAKGVFIIQSETNVKKILDRLVEKDPDLISAGQAAKAVAERQRGACKRILDRIEAVLCA